MSRTHFALELPVGVYISRVFVWVMPFGAKTIALLLRDGEQWEVCAVFIDTDVTVRHHEAPADENDEAHGLVFLDWMRGQSRDIAAQLGVEPLVDEVFAVDSDDPAVWMERLRRQSWAGASMAVDVRSLFGYSQGGAA